MFGIYNMKAYKLLSIIIIIVASIPVWIVGLKIHGDYKELRSCKSINDYENYIRKQRYICKWNNKILLYPNIFQNRAIKIYSSKQKEMINIAKKDFEICNTVTQYNEFINKYERYYDNEAEIQSLINKAFYELRSLKTVGDSSWYIDNTDWIRFSEKHSNAKKYNEK